MDDLLDFVGAWTGSYELWLDPDGEPLRSHSTAEVDLDASGCLVIRYAWTFEANPQYGLMMVTRSDEGHQLAFTDSFHSANAIFYCAGTDASVVNVLGGYEAGGQKYGWRTTVQMLAGRLVVDAFNISPDEGEEHATRAVYARSVTQ